jgi:hypothetical protein
MISGFEERKSELDVAFAGVRDDVNKLRFTMDQAGH